MRGPSVFISPEVRNQIREQVLFIAKDSIDSAFKWEERLIFALNALSDFHGHAIDEDATERIGQTLRKLVFEGTFLVHYQVDETAARIEVVNFRHGARLPQRGEP